MRARGAAAGQAVSVHRSEYRALIEWAERQRKMLPFSYIEQFKPVSEGAEHIVYHDPTRGVAVKATHPNRFGHSADGERLAATPLEYLRRLGWSNALFGDDIRIEGVAYDEEQMEVITTQPWIVAHPHRPRPSREEIDDYFSRLDFHRAALVEDAPVYFNRRIGVVILDAHDQNLLRDESGVLSPIDVVVGRPGVKLKQHIDALFPGRPVEPWPPRES
jgi:hypothetical protein